MRSGVQLLEAFGLLLTGLGDAACGLATLLVAATAAWLAVRAFSRPQHREEEEEPEPRVLIAAQEEEES